MWIITSICICSTDEYTKITTPRQDVLFKKGYLGRRKHTSVPVITEVLNENEGQWRQTDI